MTNLLRTTTQLAMYLTKAYIPPNAILIDATCGNGRDTLQLAQLRPTALYAFDIQKQALDNTETLLRNTGYGSMLESGIIQLICDSHARMESYVHQPVDAILFNLGYLPGSNKSCTTAKETTLAAANASLRLLKKDGILSITMYSGHREGALEKDALLSFASSLDPSRYHVAYINLINQPNEPPEVLLVSKK